VSFAGPGQAGRRERMGGRRERGRQQTDLGVSHEAVSKARKSG
jgi:hypothetical protein